MTDKEKISMLLALINGLLMLADTEARQGSKAWANAARRTREELERLV